MVLPAAAEVELAAAIEGNPARRQSGSADAVGNIGLELIGAGDKSHSNIIIVAFAVGAPVVADGIVADGVELEEFIGQSIGGGGVGVGVADAVVVANIERLAAGIGDGAVYVPLVGGGAVEEHPGHVVGGFEAGGIGQRVGHQGGGGGDDTRTRDGRAAVGVHVDSVGSDWRKSGEGVAVGTRD